MTLLGSRVPSTSSIAVDPGMATFAAVAEEQGASSLWVGDHVVMTREIGSRYPYASDGRLRADPTAPWFEALTACSWIAASTTVARVGTAVLVLPQRNPVEVAKVAATIDALSGGRLVLGVGAGWYREEFDVLGWDFATRGRRLDEAIRVLRACWTGAPEPFEGEFFRLPEGVMCYPTPAVRSGIPILVGGMTRRAIERAATLGDGWLAITHVQDVDVPALASALEAAHAARPSELGALRTLLRLVGTIEPDALSGMTGTLRALAALGFDEIAIDPPWPDLEASRRVLAVAAETID